MIKAAMIYHDKRLIADYFNHNTNNTISQKIEEIKNLL